MGAPIVTRGSPDELIHKGICITVRNRVVWEEDHIYTCRGMGLFFSHLLAPRTPRIYFIRVPKREQRGP